MNPLIASLGIAQIISWGSLFYAIGVLGRSMQHDLGVSQAYLFGAFTAGLVVSGILARPAGSLIDRRGGRLVLSMGSVGGAVACAVLALAPNAEVLAVGWLLAGAASAACLYDPAFATLAQHSGTQYRRSVTILTLYGGFASTVFWPLSHLLLEAWGWRATFGIYAGLHLFVCLPIHLLTSCRRSRHARTHDGAPLRSGEVSPAMGDPRLRWLAVSIAIATFIFVVMAVHLIQLLTSSGLTTAQAVTVSMLLGPLQVAGRVLEMGIAKRVKAVTVGVFAFALMLLALVALLYVDGFGIMVILFMIAFGAGNGILTIVKGTAPVELFGTRGLGGLLGYIASASIYARAIAPAAFSGLLTLGLGLSGAIACLAALAVGGIASYALATRAR